MQWKVLEINESTNEEVTLFKPNVLVTTKPQPCSKLRLIIAVDVTGGADARPNGFSNLIPQISTDKSTLSISV